jgi:hypothetical protein
MRIMLLLLAVMACELRLGAADELSAAGDVDVAVLTEANWDELVPAGKEVDAIYGDYVLQNSYLRAVVAQPLANRNANMTVRSVGGCLIDLVVRSHPSDQLSAFYPGRRQTAYRKASLVAVSPEATRVVADPADANGVRVVAEASGNRPRHEVTYWLNPGEQWLHVNPPGQTPAAKSRR